MQAKKKNRFEEKFEENEVENEMYFTPNNNEQ
jgi:hypothetical protein